jgi:hypothetical protein
MIFCFGPISPDDPAHGGIMKAGVPSDFRKGLAALQVRFHQQLITLLLLERSLP